MTNELVLLLTACVNPKGMSYTVLNDVEKRRQQYRDAINFYLSTTTLPIVVVENTLDTLGDEYKEQISQGRLEYLTFDGNNFDKSRGKGYGEAKIMLYALEHSQLLKQCRYMVKVTGRLQVSNLEQAVKSCWMQMNHIFRCDFQRTDEVATVVLAAQPADLQKLLDRHVEEITENPRGFWLERVLYMALVNDAEMRSLRLLPFVCTPKIEGESGTFGWNYKEQYSGSFVWNLYRLVNIYKVRKQYGRFACCKALHLVLTLFNRHWADGRG